MNLADNLTASAKRDADAVAIKLDDVELSYAALDGASAHVAGMLAAQGVQPGDRVGVMLPNVPYFPVVYYGILRLGASVVPMKASTCPTRRPRPSSPGTTSSRRPRPAPRRQART
jgi:long-chain acyl-CoA synthetase